MSSIIFNHRAGMELAWELNEGGIHCAGQVRANTGKSYP